MEQWQVRLFSPYLLMVLSWPFTSIGSGSPNGLFLPKHAVGYQTTRPKNAKDFAGQGENKGEVLDELVER